MVPNCSHFHADDLRECGSSCWKIAIWAESAGDISYLCRRPGKEPGERDRWRKPTFIRGALSLFPCITVGRQQMNGGNARGRLADAEVVAQTVGNCPETGLGFPP